MKKVYWPNSYSVCETIGDMIWSGVSGCFAYFPPENPMYPVVVQLEADHYGHHYRFCS